MANDLISPRLRNLLRDSFSDFGVLSIINDAFIGENVQKGEISSSRISGQRRLLVEEYYAGMDFSSSEDALRFANILADQMDRLKTLGTPEADKTLESLRLAAKRDQIEYVDGKISTPFQKNSLGVIGEIADVFNLSHLRQHINRIEGAVDTDPGLAVGSAKELLETTCKTILLELGQEIPANANLLQLARQARESLRLLPEDIEDEAKGAKTIKTLLGNLSAVAQSVTELRGLYGSGHGKEGRFRGIQPRHARLAVGSAVTLSTFLIETFLDQRQ